MLAANRSPKSSPGPARSDPGPQLGEDICMVDCSREEACTCPRSSPAPGPRTTVSLGPVLRSACPGYSHKCVPGCAELEYGEAGLDTAAMSVP